LLFRRLYIPVVTALIVLVYGNWEAGRSSQFDANTAFQNPRLSFQKGAGGVASGPDPYNLKLSAAEAEAADRGLDFFHAPIPGAGQLVYIGNSQTMAIMDRKPGDIVTAQWLQVLLNRQVPPPRRPIQLRQGSLPNLTPTEGLVRLAMAGEAAPSRIDAVLFCEVLEEFRGLSVRDEMLAEVTPEVRTALERFAAANPDLKEAGAAVHNAVPAPVAPGAEGEKLTVAQRLDKSANDAANHMPLFALRSEMRGRVVDVYYSNRNRALHITSASPRPVPDEPYLTSLQMVELTFRYAKSKNIPVFVYLTPLRPITPNPNVPADVARFRKDMPPLCAKYGVAFADYTDLVPEKLWTTFYANDVAHAGDLDFSHFTGEAHKLVAENLMKDFGSRFMEAAGGAAGRTPAP
jgi:hypothetical protein